MIKTIYFSPTGTTKKVVEAIASSFGEMESIDLTLKKNRNTHIDCSSDDILILGLPVYAGRIPSSVEEVVKNIKGDKTPCIIVAVYGNRHYDDALVEMNDIVVSNGFYPLAAGAFIGEHSYSNKLAEGRPDKRDLEVCESFAAKIDLSCKGELILPGNRPYRQRNKSLPLGPTVNHRCTRCGICVMNCPTEALTLKGFVSVDESKCIKCHACVKNCATLAIDFDNRIDPIRVWLVDNFTSRREPELFYREVGGNNES